MKTKNDERMLLMDLQLFAEDDGQDNGSGDQGNDDVNHGTDDQNRGEKTFTQTEVSGMMAKEKNEGRRSVLKALGFKSEDEAKEAITKYNEYLEAQKSEADKKNEALNKANDEKKEAEKRAQLAENKVACYQAGINPEYVDDVLAIASLKISDEKDLETVLKEMKEDKKYGGFFGKDSSSGSKHGTGSNAGHSGKEDEVNDLGKRLAEQHKKTAITKSNFFND